MSGISGWGLGLSKFVCCGFSEDGTLLLNGDIPLAIQGHFCMTTASGTMRAFHPARAAFLDGPSASSESKRLWVRSGLEHFQEYLDRWEKPRSSYLLKLAEKDGSNWHPFHLEQLGVFFDSCRRLSSMPHCETQDVFQGLVVADWTAVCSLAYLCLLWPSSFVVFWCRIKLRARCSLPQGMYVKAKKKEKELQRAVDSLELRRRRFVEENHPFQKHPRTDFVELGFDSYVAISISSYSWPFSRPISTYTIHSIYLNIKWLMCTHNATCYVRVQRLQRVRWVWNCRVRSITRSERGLNMLIQAIDGVAPSLHALSKAREARNFGKKEKRLWKMRKMKNIAIFLHAHNETNLDTHLLYVCSDTMINLQRLEA